MKSLFAILILCLGSVAWAGEFVGAVGTNVSYQLASSGRVYEPKAPFSIRGGYRFSFVDVLAEYSYIHSSTGTDQVSIAQSNQEVLIWARKGDPTAHKFIPFVALGAGAHAQTVETRFAGTTEKNVGRPTPLAALAVGFEIRIWRGVALTLEGRAATAEDDAPNPLFGLGSYLNFEF